MKAHGHVAFDRLPSQAPGLKSKDPEVTLLLQLAKAPCMPRRKDAAAKLTGSVRCMLNFFTLLSG